MNFCSKPFLLFFAAALILPAGGAASTQNSALPPMLRGVGIDQKLDTQVPLGTAFRDETGASVTLKEYFTGKPVIIAPVYYTCPMLCTQILQGLVGGLKPLSYLPGKDFNVIAISFDPSNTPQDATEKRDLYARRYWGHNKGNQGFHFLVGSPDSIHAVMNAIGFRYRWDPKLKMFIHASGIVVLTPEGRVSRYFYGVDYEPKDLKLGLVDSSHHRIGSVVDEILLFCCKYDPTTGKYTFVVLDTLRWAAVLTIIGMAAGFFFLWRHDVGRTRWVHSPSSIEERPRV